VRLAGEGGGLVLYELKKGGATRYTWDSAWGFPDESGEIPAKQAPRELQAFPSIAEAMEAAPRWWIHLIPTYIRDDLHDRLLGLVSAKLTTSGMSTQDIEEKVKRWKTAGLPHVRGAL
jgi:hypothetical protein